MISSLLCVCRSGSQFPKRTSFFPHARVTARRTTQSFWFTFAKVIPATNRKPRLACDQNLRINQRLQRNGHEQLDLRPITRHALHERKARGRSMMQDPVACRAPRLHIGAYFYPRRAQQARQLMRTPIRGSHRHR